MNCYRFHLMNFKLSFIFVFRHAHHVIMKIPMLFQFQLSSALLSTVSVLLFVACGSLSSHLILNFILLYLSMQLLDVVLG